MAKRVGPCVKQVVTATIVSRDGQQFVGTNHCNNAQKVCPRADMPTGVGYELCRSICEQPAHAEINAIAEAGPAADGGVLYLQGHTYACGICSRAAAEAGIVAIVVGAGPPETV
jgi:deoxycytidylate deaminase